MFASKGIVEHPAAARSGRALEACARPDALGSYTFSPMAFPPSPRYPLLRSDPEWQMPNCEAPSFSPASRSAATT